MRNNNLKVYICHWDKLVSRKKVLQQSLQKHHLTNVEWIESFSADGLDIEAIKQEYPNILNLNSRGVKMSNNQISIALKHCEVVKKIVSGHDNQVLILEDDIIFCENFLTFYNEYIQQLPNDWDFFWLADYSWKYYPNVTVDKNIYRKNGYRYIHGFALSKKGANKIINKLWQMDRPIDNFYDHLIKKYHLNSYWVEPPLIFQNMIFRSSLGNAMIKERIKALFNSLISRNFGIPQFKLTLNTIHIIFLMMKIFVISSILRIKQYFIKTNS